MMVVVVEICDDGVTQYVKNDGNDGNNFCSITLTL